MRPVPIEDEMVWDGSKRVVLMPPDDDLDSRVAPVEVLRDEDSYGPRHCILVSLEDEDIETLRENGKFWFVVYGNRLPVFSVEHLGTLDKS